MSKLRYSASISLDGFAAGPDQSREHPLGRGGRVLHEWTRVDSPSSSVLEEDDLGVGALLMGRNVFGGGPGPWGREPWNGWWGPNPPFHLPVFLGAAVRLFDDTTLDRVTLEQAFVVKRPGVTHLKYRVLH